MSLDAGGGRERRLCGVLAEKVWPEYIYEETGDRGGDQTVKCIFFGLCGLISAQSRTI